MHNYLVHGEKSGEALCPYDPTYPSTATFYGNFSPYLMMTTLQLQLLL